MFKPGETDHGAKHLGELVVDKLAVSTSPVGATAHGREV